MGGTYLLGDLTTPFTVLKLISGQLGSTRIGERKGHSIVDDYPDEDPSECEDNICGCSQGCDLLTGYSGDQFNKFLRILGSWTGVRTKDLKVMM